MSDIVIGSGPSGLAVTRARLERGNAVIMLDGGRQLEPEAAAAAAELAASTPDKWTDAMRRQFKQRQFDAPEGQTRRYGSDFAMEPAAAVFDDPAAPLALRSSRAVGGLSNLWGAAVLPYRDADLAGWPVSAHDLLPHVRAVAGFVPIAGAHDELDTLFSALPLTADNPVPSSRQGRRILSRIGRRTADLRAMGVVAGTARLALAPGCRECGLCLHGCPWHLIWSAAHGVEELAGTSGFTHRPGAVATAIAETDAGVEVRLAGGEVVTGDRLFVAAGVLETARLLLASKMVPDRLILRDSRQAFLPMLQLRTARRPDRAPLTTLPQVFLECTDPAVSPFTVHAQLYTWNDAFARDLRRNYGSRLPGSGPLLDAVARRLVVAQIFLHSDHSAEIELAAGAEGRLRVEVRANGRGDAVMAAAVRRLGAAARLIGLVPLAFARRDGPAGASFHAGASLPMSNAPQPGRSDRLGRPHGLARVHVVDASVLPAIPATTITLPVMANAHRIGIEAP